MLKYQEIGERVIATKTGENGAHTKNPKINLIKWPLYLSESIARNWAQNEAQINQKLNNISYQKSYVSNNFFVEFFQNTVK